MKMMKCVLSVVCALSLMLAAAVPGLALEVPTPTSYGLDNLLDESGSQPLKIAYLGGSITEGSGASNPQNRYASLLTKEYFEKNYANGREVIEINGGVGGTPSDLGLYRMAKDISAEAPDVVFVEFAVNDRNRGETAAKNMEGIVRQLSKLPKRPVIIFLYTAAQPFEVVENFIPNHQKIADYYGIGSINLNKMVTEHVAAGDFTWEKDGINTYSGDGTHPNDKGYRLYADYIMEQFDANWDQYFKNYTYQEVPLTNYEYGYPHLLPATDPSITYSEGDWTRDDSRFNQDNRFEDGAMETTAEGATIEFTFTGRSFGVFATRGDEGAKASYVIDEGTPQQKNGTINNYYKHNDYNEKPKAASFMACSTHLIDNLAYGEHTVKITTLAPGNEAGYTQNLFSIGYFFIDDVDPDLGPAVRKVSASGSTKLGSTLTGSYEYYNFENASDKGQCTFRWLISDTKEGPYNPIENATGLTYATKTSDAEKFIKFEVTAVGSDGTYGNVATSEPIQLDPKGEFDIFDITEPIGFYQNDVPVTGITAGEIKSRATIENTSNDTINVTMLTCEYTEVGDTLRLVNVVTASKNFEPGISDSIEASITINNIYNKVVRTYIVYSDTMYPIGAANQLD